MSEFKGMPGPWVVDEEFDVTTKDGVVISWTAQGVFKTGERTANANLIAAAPELLEVLQCAIHHVREQAKSDAHAAGVLKACDAVIKKALGR